MIKNHLNSIKDAENSFYNFQKFNPDPYSLESDVDFVWNSLTKEYQAKVLKYAKIVKRLLKGETNLSEQDREEYVWGLNEGVTCFHIPDYVGY